MYLPLPISDFPGIGKSLQLRCANYKIETLGDLITFKRMVENWGKIGKDLITRVTGEDNELVIAHRDRKSIGISRNFELIYDREEVFRRATILLVTLLTLFIKAISIQQRTILKFVMKEEPNRKNLKPLIDYSQRAFIGTNASNF